MLMLYQCATIFLAIKIFFFLNSSANSGVVLLDYKCVVMYQINVEKLN